MMNIVTILIGIVDFCNELDVIFCLNLSNGIMPKRNWHHFCHIAAESINTFTCPKQQNISHLLPSRRNGVKVLGSTSIIIYSVIKLYCFVPIVAIGPSVKNIVTSCFCRIFKIRNTTLLCFNKIFRMQWFTPAIIEVVSRSKG